MLSASVCGRAVAVEESRISYVTTVRRTLGYFVTMTMMREDRMRADRTSNNFHLKPQRRGYDQSMGDVSTIYLDIHLYSGTLYQVASVKSAWVNRGSVR